MKIGLLYSMWISGVSKDKVFCWGWLRFGKPDIFGVINEEEATTGYCEKRISEMTEDEIEMQFKLYRNSLYKLLNN